MQSPETQKAKKSLRNSLAAARVDLAKDPGTASMIAAQLNQLTSDLHASTVAAYLPFGAEPNIGEFLESARVGAIRLLMPVSQPDGTLNWVEYTGESEVGIFGFPEPIGASAQLLDADLILIPASAADLHGNRLGKGRGFYDRALEGVPARVPLAAVVYDEELLDSVPVESHDHPVNYLVTPKRTVAVGNASMS
jgi:5-formyltetrahydrofolate cyclo-ligase